MISHRYLLGQLVKRDVLLRYRGAMFGVLWVLLNPLIMLAIFAFVFGHIFQARWPRPEGGAPFWLVLYSGLIVFNVFAEAVSRSPTAVRGHPSYVKKIIFPVEILPLVPLGAALVHGAFNFLILVAALVWVGLLTPQIVLCPVLLLPLALLGYAFFRHSREEFADVLTAGRLPVSAAQGQEQGHCTGPVLARRHAGGFHPYQSVAGRLLISALSSLRLSRFGHTTTLVTY